MRAQDLLIHPSRMASNLNDSWQPLGFVDLDACPADVRLESLPAFPLIGLGNPAHPLASALDAIVEAPVSAEALIRLATRMPHAAAVAIQLLRSLEGLTLAQALQMESICYGMLQGSAEYQGWLAGRAAAEPATVATSAGRIIVERHGSVLHVVIDRPEARNAIDRSLRDQLFEAFTIAALDREVSAVQLRATGATFSVGADLGEFGTTRDPATAHLIRSRTLPALVLAQRAAIFDVHVQGACVGSGLEMAAFAARLTAASNAWFQLPELAMGLIPGAGGCVSVPRRIGRQRAGLMILGARRINAQTALRWGLIDAIED